MHGDNTVHSKHKRATRPPQRENVPQRRQPRRHTRHRPKREGAPASLQWSAAIFGGWAGRPCVFVSGVRAFSRGRAGGKEVNKRVCACVCVRVCAWATQGVGGCRESPCTVQCTQWPHWAVRYALRSALHAHALRSRREYPEVPDAERTFRPAANVWPRWLHVLAAGAPWLDRPGPPPASCAVAAACRGVLLLSPPDVNKTNKHTAHRHAPTDTRSRRNREGRHNKTMNRWKNVNAIQKKKVRNATLPFLPPKKRYISGCIILGIHSHLSCSLSLVSLLSLSEHHQTKPSTLV